MISVVYLAIFVASLALIFRDKDFETVKKPCVICMPRHLIIFSIACLFIGAEAFAFFGAHKVWVISAVMALSISGFIFGIFCGWELRKWMLALLQMVYVVVITVHFYSWW